MLLSDAHGPAAILRRIEKLSWLVLAALGAPALALAPLPVSGGIILGGIVAIGNFRCMDFYFELVFRKSLPRPKWWAHALYASRFLGLLGAIGAAFYWGDMNPVGLVIGLSTPIAAITLFGILSLGHRGSAARI